MIAKSHLKLFSNEQRNSIYFFNLRGEKFRDIINYLPHLTPEMFSCGSWCDIGGRVVKLYDPFQFNFPVPPQYILLSNTPFELNERLLLIPKLTMLTLRVHCDPLNSG